MNPAVRNIVPETLDVVGQNEGHSDQVVNSHRGRGGPLAALEEFENLIVECGHRGITVKLQIPLSVTALAPVARSPIAPVAVARPAGHERQPPPSRIQFEQSRQVAD